MRSPYEAVLSAVHGGAPPTRGWLEALNDVVGQKLGRGLGAMSFRFDLDAPPEERLPVVTTDAIASPMWRWRAPELHTLLDADTLAALYTGHVGLSSEAWPKIPEAIRLPFAEAIAEDGIADAEGIFGHGPAPRTGVSLNIASPVPMTRIAPRRRAMLERIGRHVSLVLELTTEVDAAPAGAFVHVDEHGHMLHVAGEGAGHAVGDGAHRPPRELVELAGVAARQASLGIARGSVTVWEELVRLGLSVRVYRDGGGKRAYAFLAPRPEPPALTPREREIVELFTAGSSLKEAAFALGVSPSTAASLLARAEAKGAFAATRLGDEARRDAAALAQRFGLTPAEESILEGLMLGLSNATMAGHRQRSARTIANQVKTTLAKIGRTRTQLRLGLYVIDLPGDLRGSDL